VIRTRVGYTGGTTIDPEYHRLGDHTEAFQLDFDPRRLSYAELLEQFWRSHDPTRPGYKRQYMAAVFAGDDAQLALAEASRDARGGVITTSVERAKTFYRAEDYHQKYYLRQHKDLMRELRAVEDDRKFVDSTIAARLNGVVAGKATREQIEAMIDGFHLSPEAKAALLCRQSQ